MKHYIWLSVLLAAGVIKVAAAAEADKTDAPAAEAANAGEENKAEEAAAGEENKAEVEAAAPEEEADSNSEDKKSKKSKSKGKKARRARNRKKGRKGRKGGQKVNTPSASVLNAYMNRVQSGEMCSTAPESSMSVIASDQGACATGKCGLQAPEAAPEAASEANAAA